jgi:two-component system, OmpR family, sensor histidine kinase NblS
LFSRWWSEFTLQTKLMAGVTLVVSLLMSSLTFWAVNSIQEDARMNDTRFGRDLGLLMAANAAPMVADHDLKGLAQFSGRFFQSTSSVRYLIYADQKGEIFFGIPYSEAQTQNSLTIKRYIALPEDYGQNTSLPMVRQHDTPNGEITDVFVPLKQGDDYLGVLAIGINPNATVVAYSNLTRDVTIAVFISIWAMVILGAVFNAFNITKPIKELLVGVKNIATGNFKQRINLPFGGELGELIVSFNEMAERLETYEEQNIEELTTEKAKLETLVTTIADGAVLINKKMQVLLINPTASRIFGWENQEVIGKNVLHYLPQDLKIKLVEPLYQLITGKNPENIDLDYLKYLESLENIDNLDILESHEQNLDILENEQLIQNNPNILISDSKESANKLQENTLESQKNSDYYHHDHYPPVEFRITIQEPNIKTLRILLSKVLDKYRENVQGIAITIQDITREAELNDAKSQFISNVSHELRTPLFNIKSFIETLAEYGEDLTEKERKEFLETANHETDRLTRLVNDVLDLSRLESSRIYQLEPVDIIQPIEQTLRTYQLNAKDKNIQLSHQIDQDLPSVLGHYDLLLQVLTNLVGNSLKFTLSGGKVSIRSYKIKDKSNQKQPIEKVRIEIADTGIGIDKEDQNAIFERFFRVENRVHTLEGTGLGLSIVKNIIVDKHQSQVNLISEVGIGTTFWFDLDIY